MNIEKQERSPYGPLPTEGAVDWFDRRCAQAEALSMLMIGEAGVQFRMFRDDIQENAAWLLSNLIEELRHAHAAALEEERSARSPAACGVTVAPSASPPSPFRS